MCIYEDYGLTPDRFGPQIACCNIEELTAAKCKSRYCDASGKGKDCERCDVDRFRPNFDPAFTTQARKGGRS